MSDDFEESARPVVLARLAELLENLKIQGVNQGQVAARVKVPAQYLSDVKGGARPMTELFARRLQEEFGVNYLWLLGQSHSMQVPHLDPRGNAASSQRTWLPAFPHPIEGDPHAHRLWDGSLLEVTGAAAAQATVARFPYILRFGANDRRGRLHLHDLVLISQLPNAEAEMHVITSNGKAFLARRTEGGEWERLAEKGKQPVQPVVIGHAIGIIWGNL